MKVILLLNLFLTTVTLFGQETFDYNNDFKKILAKTQDSKDSLFYEKQLKRFESNDTTLTNFEVLALLIGFTAKSDYRPYQDIDTEREVYNLNGEKNYRDGLKLGQKFIKTHPLSVKTCFEIAYSFDKLGKEDSAKYYAYQGQRIIKAMFFSGNGKTIETPTFALGPADGQDYIYKFVGGDIGTMGSGSDKLGNFLDILEVKFENGRTMNLYFIIQHATEKMFDGKSLKEVIKEQNKKQKKSKN